jgi:hypothetical protein
VFSAEVTFLFSTGRSVFGFGLDTHPVTDENDHRSACPGNGPGSGGLRMVTCPHRAQFTIPAGPLVEMVAVEHPDAHLIFTFAILGEVTAMQLVCADRRGRWP